MNPERDADALSRGQKIFNVVKSATGSYGFSLITNPGTTPEEFDHCIRDVKEGGPADVAGVKNQMILLAMNGHDAIKMKHQVKVISRDHYT